MVRYLLLHGADVDLKNKVLGTVQDGWEEWGVVGVCQIDIVLDFVQE